MAETSLSRTGANKIDKGIAGPARSITSLRRVAFGGQGILRIVADWTRPAAPQGRNVIWPIT